MVRDYATDPVDPGIVERALHNAVRAPNAGFSQGWGFLVLDEPADVRRFWEVTTDPDDLAAPDEWLTGMMHAPVLVLPCSSKAAYLKRYAQEDKGWTDEDETRWAVPFWHIDTGMAALLILQTVDRRGTRRLLLRGAAGPRRGGPRGVRDPGDVRPDRCDHHRPPHHDRRAAGLAERAAAPAPGGRRPPRTVGQLDVLTARPPVHRSDGDAVNAPRGHPGLASETALEGIISGHSRPRHEERP